MNIGQTMQLACVPGDVSFLHEDIDATLSKIPDFNLSGSNRTRVTGVLSQRSTGQVWITENREPYRIDARYLRVL